MTPTALYPRTTLTVSAVTDDDGTRFVQVKISGVMVVLDHDDAVALRDTLSEAVA